MVTIPILLLTQQILCQTVSLIEHAKESTVELSSEQSQTLIFLKLLIPLKFKPGHQMSKQSVLAIVLSPSVTPMSQP